MWRHQLHARQVFDVRARARGLLDNRDFLARLRGVRMHERVMLLRQARDRLEQIARARDGKSRRERRVQTAVGGAVPAFVDRDAFVDRMPRLLPQALRRLRVEVHHAFADRRAQTAGVHLLKHHIRVVHRLHRQHRGGAARQELRRGQPCGGAQRLRGVRGFHRPHARAQPVHQLQVVRVAAKQCLAEMNVGLDQPGQDVPAARLDDAVVVAGEIRSNRRDAAVPDRHIAFNHIPAIVHRQDSAAADQQGHEQLSALNSQGSLRVQP